MSKIAIAITGSRGVIGTVLLSGLQEFSITSLNLPDVDVRSYEQLLKHFKGVSTVIHLAKSRNIGAGDVSNSDNLLMMRNVYKASVDANVKRVIMASSVHADNFYDWKGPGKLSINRVPKPRSAYGLDKVAMEVLGEEYAKKGLEVVCVRFGGVNVSDMPPKDDYWEEAVWLSHKDCVAAIRACLIKDKIPNNFAVFYAVSDNENKAHDTSNPLGWK